MNLATDFDARPAAGPPPHHILLVEDNPGDADLTCERLAESWLQEFVVSRATTLADAVSVLMSSRVVDAIILDLNLPDSIGVETVRRIKRVKAHAPIIAMSGQVDDAMRMQARNEGAEDLFRKDESNSRLFWRCVVQIIDRKRAQRRQFEALLDAAPDGILLVDPFGSVRYANQAAIELFGKSREVLQQEPLGFALDDGAPIELHISRADGERACEMRVVRIEWEDEQAWLASVRDITDRKRVAALQLENQRMETASRLKSAFLANMSHELRTPLNAIIGFSQLLIDGRVDAVSPKYEVFLGHILSSGKHLLQLINDVLDLAKVESGKLSFFPEPVDLRLLTEEVADILSVIAAQKSVRIVIEFDATLNDIELDPGRYKQVLYNFLSNALKFSADAGYVGVRVLAADEQHFRVEVRDSGAGIAAEDVDKLFTEFQQLNGSSAKRRQGTGLGLALTKRLVEAQGGQVGARSTLGQGSEFFALLPRKIHLRGEAQ